MLSNVEAPVLTIRSCEKQDAECVTHLMHEVSYPTRRELCGRGLNLPR